VAVERSPRSVTREAVRAALAEHKKIAQEAFLKKYGFKPSRKYRLWFDSEPYDSKAISRSGIRLSSEQTKTAPLAGVFWWAKTYSYHSDKSRI